MINEAVARRDAQRAENIRTDYAKMFILKVVPATGDDRAPSQYGRAPSKWWAKLRSMMPWIKANKPR